jgi:predicted membrane chloride channel (bestrophin family)
LFVLKGRPFFGGTEGARGSEPFVLYVVWAIGIGLVVLSALVGVTLEEDRKCHAWCSQFSLGPQAHSYVGVVLFLLLAFRTNTAYRFYESGLSSWTVIRRNLLSFTSAMLNMTPRNSITKEQRVRMLAWAMAFPYALHADLRESRLFRKCISSVS